MLKHRADSVPEAYSDLNRNAFDKGYEYGIKAFNCSVQAVNTSNRAR
jgi:hypothetical protein